MNDLELLRAIISRDLLAFLQRAWREIERDELVLRPYVEFLCAELMRVVVGQERRLIINLPPRHIKSILVSKVFPAFLLARDPTMRIAVVSHSMNLAHDLALPCHRIVSSKWYKAFFPKTRLRADRNRTDDFETTEGGGRYAASIDTGITGRGFDIVIVDDPLSANNLESLAERERVNDIYHNMIASRLNDPSRGAFIIVHQRLHEDDLSGALLAKGGWRHVNLPLIAEEETIYQTGDRRWVRAKGDILLPERFPLEEIQRLRAAQGEAIFSTQYQQNPSATVGEYIKREDICFFEDPPRESRVVLSFDTATKQNENSSYSVCLVVASDQSRHFVLDVLRARLGSVDLRDAALRLIEQYKPNNILIEGASSGDSLQDMLKERKRISELVPTRGRTKEQRLQSVIHHFRQKRVYIKQNEPWSQELANEWMRFPAGKHDDQVDAMTQYLSWWQDNPPKQLFLASGGTLEDRQAAKIFGSPPPRGQSPMRPRDGSRFCTGR
jgi:predicted phage terminase large subunit-like protein